VNLSYCTTHKLETLFREALEVAEITATEVDTAHLWQQVEAVVEHLNQAEQLYILGVAIAALADICGLKAEQFWNEWQQYDLDGPILPDDFLAGLCRQSTALDLTDLVNPVERPGAGRTPDESDSLVGVVEKDVLLDVIDEIAEHEAALSVAHSENVTAWVDTLQRAIAHLHHRERVSLRQLQKMVNLPLIEIWLALLLGGYVLEARDEFYARDVWVMIPKAP
jgi:hypothetical protein